MLELTVDTAIQATFLVLTLAIFLVIYNFPHKAISTKLRSNARSSSLSNRHFLNGAHLLTRARSTRNRAHSISLAKSALSEADNALAIQPRDPGSHILRALALDLLGRHAPALRTLDMALSPPLVKMLSEREKGDALVKRAEIQMAVNKRRRVDSAVEDLVEAVGLTRDNPKAFCLLGQCYEFKGLKDEARKAYSDGLDLDPESVLAHEGLDRLNS